MSATSVQARIGNILGDLPQQDVDAVVCPAEPELRGSNVGGVAGAIVRAAGPELPKACKRLSGCSPGHAKITRGYKLPARWIIHAVGPVWLDGKQNEQELLARTYQSALELAELHGLRTIALPVLGTGPNGFPLSRACRIGVLAVKTYLLDHPLLERVIFVSDSNRTYDILLGHITEL